MSPVKKIAPQLLQPYAAASSHRSLLAHFPQRPVKCPMGCPSGLLRWRSAASSASVQFRELVMVSPYILAFGRLSFRLSGCSGLIITQPNLHGVKALFWWAHRDSGYAFSVRL